MDFFNPKDGQDRLGNVSFLAGYNINNYIAVEGRYTTTFAHKDKVSMDGWSLFAKPQYPVNEDFSVYALLGFGGVNLDPESIENVDVDDTSFQWGLGMSYVMTENFDVFIDYTSLANDMDGIYYNGALQVDVDAITLGVIYNF
jgi:opacity protein-like surface antigen